MLKSIKVKNPWEQSVYFESVDPDQVAQAPIKDILEGTCSVEGFKIDLKTASYAIQFGHGCRYYFSGTLEWKRGRWNASPPHLDGVACSK